MLIPYAVFAVIGFGIMLVFDSWKPGLSPFDFAMKYVYYTQPPALGQTWFLVALLVSSVLFYISCRIVRVVPEKARGFAYGAVMLLYAAAGAVVMGKVHIPRFGRLPWKIDTALTAVVFMLAGHVVRKTGFPEKPGLIARAVLTVLLPVVVWFVSVRGNGYVNICDCVYGNIVLYYIGAMAGCLWVCLLGKWLESVRWICWLGKNSLPISASIPSSCGRGSGCTARPSPTWTKSTPPSASLPCSSSRCWRTPAVRCSCHSINGA